MKLFLDLGLVLVTISMMLSVGIALGGCLFRDVWKRRGPMAVLLTANILLPPLIALAVATLTRMPPEAAGGLLLIAACPIGDIANLYVLRARGNLAVSLSLNATTCVLFPLTMPFIFAIYRITGNTHELFATPRAAEAMRLFLCFALPVLVGWLLRNHRPDWANAISRPLHLATSTGILVVLALILVLQFPILCSTGPVAAGSSLLFLLAGLGVAFLLASCMGAPEGERIAGICCLPVRNVGIAALAAVTLGGHLGFAGFAAIYFLVEVPLLLLLAAFLGRRS